MQVRNEVKELRLLFEVLQILDSASDLSDNLETVLEVMAEHTGMMRGVITLLDEAHGEIAIEAAYGMSAEAQSKGRYKLGEGITGKVIESGKPLVIPNVLVEPLFLNRTGSRSRKEAVSFIWSSCCACCRSRNSSGSAAWKPARWTCASWRPRAGISSRWSRTGCSAGTCITG